MLTVAAVIVLGLALLGLAGIIGLAARRDWGLWRLLGRLEPMTPDQLVRDGLDRGAVRGGPDRGGAVRGGVDRGGVDRGGLDRRGRVRPQVVALVGVARPGPAGPLESTVNAQACVWHRHTVHRRRVRRRADGRTRPSVIRRRVADVTSREPFTLAGPAIRVELRPEGFQVDRPTRTGLRILPGLASKPFPDADGLLGGDQYAHREWTLHSGASLLVLGEATATGGRVVVRRPAAGPHIISTRGVAGLRRHQLLAAVGGFGLAALVAAAGLGVLIAFIVG